MANYTTPALPPDATGDIRYPQEASFQIKAWCIRCVGRKYILLWSETRSEVNPWDPTGAPIVSKVLKTAPCTFCNTRGYYFLPLGD